MKSEKITLVVPFYNSAAYIERCIKSLQRQTFNDFMVILVSDGSTDNSEKIVSTLTEHDPKFVMVHNLGKGLSDARNTGIKLAHGKYIAFIDSDDYVRKDYLEKLYTTMSVNNSDLCLLKFSVVNSDGLSVGSKIRPSVFPDGSVTNTVAMKLLMQDRIRHYAWSMMIQKDILNKQNIAFPSGRNYEDLATTYKIFAAAQKVSFVHDEIYCYVQHANSITHQYKEKDATDIWHTILEIDDYFSDHLNLIEIKLVHQYELNRLFNAYHICMRTRRKDQLASKIRSAIIYKTKLSKLYPEMSWKEKLKFLLLKIYGLKIIYRYV